MRVLMLGWEFPPHISGGLGTACLGLTRALDRLQTKVTFVLPTGVSEQTEKHVKLIAADGSIIPSGPDSDQSADISQPNSSQKNSHQAACPTAAKASRWTVTESSTMRHIRVRPIHSPMISPYQSVGGRVYDIPPHVEENIQRARVHLETKSDAQKIFEAATPGSPGSSEYHHRKKHHPKPIKPVYEGDIIAQANAYALQCVHLAKSEDFDIIHAHDWMTYPAGLALAKKFKKPLVVHIHSTEFDRSGEHVNQAVYDIERQGLHGADRVFAVSYLTRSILEKRYDVPAEKITVVYNGIENNNNNGHQPALPIIRKGEKVVLFMGRITVQKGPEYFIHAAKRVLEKLPNVTFVMAGSGDQTESMMSLAQQEGVDEKLIFTGFLRGNEIDRIFRMANVFVMPSVSVPFGIAPLEAISHDVPVIISKTSGVAEVLKHALKVDFWDIDEIANKIIAVLKHDALSQTLRVHADVELRRLTWDEAAQKCILAYEELITAPRYNKKHKKITRDIQPNLPKALKL
ncbi:MAG: glycosyltransferase family 4 protein [Phycisphaeraceae bacterium]|nr:glycosyltransferase family 4 protein [Phycisphaeraceae bacterium]